MSMAVVLICHLIGTQGFPIGMERAYPLAGWVHLGMVGNFAMAMFFVLSGFLITHSLLEECKTSGKLSLHGFYLSRCCRILPVAFTYAAVIGLLSLGGIGQFGMRDVFSTLTYTANYDPHRSIYIRHFWSLALEEQFYLIWPAVLAFCGLGRATKVLVAVIAACPLLRVGIYLTVDPQYGYEYWLPFHADGFAAGCLLACIRERVWVLAWYKGLLASPFMWPFAFFLVSLSMVGDWQIGRHLALTTIIHLGLAICLDFWMRYPRLGPARLLNHPKSIWLGRLSYSLYIWQWPFVNRYTGFIVSQFPLNVLVTFLAGWISYRFIESPMHKVGRRLRRAGVTPRRRPGFQQQRGVQTAAIRR